MKQMFKTLLCILLATTTLHGQGKKWFIPLDEDYFIADANQQVLPGDTLVLQGGDRWKHLQIKEIHGTPTNPVVIINEPNKTVTFRKAKEGSGGVLSITYSSNVLLTGSGNGGSADKGHPNYYGIRLITDTANVMLSFSHGTTAITAERIYIEGAKVSVPDLNGKNKAAGAAISAKTDPKCSDGVLENYYGEFTLENLFIRNCYIKNAGAEGIYAGFTNGSSSPVTISGGECLQKYLYTQVPVIENGKVVGVITKIDTVNRKVTTVMPHMLKNVQIYDNVFDGTGWDGIQVNWACDVTIRNNKITNYGFLDNTEQKNGINLGTNFAGKIYNNYINGGKGFGISVKPDGDVDIINNIVINAGVSSRTDTNARAAIVFYNSGYQDDYLYYQCADFNPIKKTNIYNNLIIAPRLHGVSLDGGTKGGNPNNFEINVGNNIVVGNFIEKSSGGYSFYLNPFYRQGGAINFALNSDIAFGTNRNKSDTATLCHAVNKKYKTIDELRLVNTSTLDPMYWDYNPTSSSPFLNKGINFTKVLEIVDYYYKRRFVAKKGSLNHPATANIITYQGTIILPSYIDMGPVEHYTIFNDKPALRLANQEELSEATNDAWSIYPNPATNHLYLNGDISKVKKMIIYNLLGMQIMEVTGSMEELKIAELPTGYYQVQLYLDSGEVQSFKLMKQE